MDYEAPSLILLFVRITGLLILHLKDSWSWALPQKARGGVFPS